VLFFYFNLTSYWP